MMNYKNNGLYYEQKIQHKNNSNIQTNFMNPKQSAYNQYKTYYDSNEEF